MSNVRVEASVTSISWIPSEAVAGMAKMPFSVGVAHYDDPPPEHIGAPGSRVLASLRDADRFRFANELRAFTEFDPDGRVVAAGYRGAGMIGSTTMRLGGASTTVAAVAMSDRQREPEVGDGHVRFVQSCGGRTGVPAPRTVRHPPFVRFHAPTAWTTLALTIRADGSSEHELVGASTFPRHWLYDHSGALVAKSGLIDFTNWYAHAFGKHTPWGDLDTPALATEVESALERDLSRRLMSAGDKLSIRRVSTGQVLVQQGRVGNELFVLLDGVLAVDVDGAPLAELGPGVVVGERALIEGGTRTATLRAVTRCTIAVVDPQHVDWSRLERLSAEHRREDQ